MSSVANVPVRSEHPRRPLLWLSVAFLAAFALAAGILSVHDSGTESAVESRAASTGLVPTAVAPTACRTQYGFLLATMATTMSPEAVNRIVPVLSEETRTGIRDVAEVMAFTNCLSPTPDRDTLAWALGRLTPPERAAIMAELPPTIREAVANGALDAAVANNIHT
jgi:hypothetical protein